MQAAHLVDAAVSSSRNQHIMLCSSTTALGNKGAEAADQMAGLQGADPLPTAAACTAHNPAAAADHAVVSCPQVLCSQLRHS